MIVIILQEKYDDAGTCKMIKYVDDNHASNHWSTGNSTKNLFQVMEKKWNNSHYNIGESDKNPHAWQ